MGNSKQATRRNANSIRWEFDPETPTYDFFEGLSLDNAWDLQEVVENFIFRLEDERFATWEAVVCEEQGLPLTPEQKKLLDDLLNFDDPDDDQILYVNGIPRPSEPWHAILNKIVPHLLLDPYVPWAVHEDVQVGGWNRLLWALRKYGRRLSLPEGASSVEEVVPAELRHRLWLQDTFDALAGLRGNEKSNLTEQPWRIDEFIQNLRDRKESVEYLGLTLNSLLSYVVLPERDRPLFLQMMKEKLELTDDDERIADRL